MITVRVSTNFSHWPLARQTSRGSGKWGDCRFVLNHELLECDYWVVLDGITHPETARCDPENTLLVTCEPPDVKSYSATFVNQFGAVLTSHREVNHPRLLFGQQGLPWMIGARLDPKSLTWSRFMSFEELEALSTRKQHLVSVVASKNKANPGHAARDRFIDELKRKLGDRLAVFGLGYTPIADKLDAIGPYRYHVAIENSCVADYWTEKLADSYLGGAFPIYSGCPNLEDYFPAGSYERLEIRDPVAAAERVADVVGSNIDKERVREVAEARWKVLYEHNVFAVLEKLVEQLRQPSRARPHRLTLHPQSLAETRPPNVIGRVQRRLRRLIR